jgi:hypothetical protein
VTSSTRTAPPTTSRRVFAALLALALVSLLVLRTSDAAFTAGDRNDGNLFRTATIALGVAATQPLFGLPGDALVDATGLIPGHSVTGCVEVGFTDDAGAAAGSLAPVELALDWNATGTGSADALAGWLDVEVAVHAAGCDGALGGQGTGVTTGNPSGTVADGFADTTTTWTPAGDGDQVGYVITVTLDADADDTVQGAAVTGVDLVWSVSTT